MIRPWRTNQWPALSNIKIKLNTRPSASQKLTNSKTRPSNVTHLHTQNSPTITGDKQLYNPSPHTQANQALLILLITMNETRKKNKHASYGEQKNDEGGRDASPLSEQRLTPLALRGAATNVILSKLLPKQHCHDRERLSAPSASCLHGRNLYDKQKHVIILSKSQEYWSAAR